MTSFPVIMIIATSLPGMYARPAFVVMNALSNIAFATVYLNIQQMLLEVLPEKNKTLNISLYTMLVMLSNAFMPMAGVALYSFMGADLKAFQTVYCIIFFMRMIAASLWFVRWRLVRNEAES